MLSPDLRANQESVRSWIYQSERFIDNYPGGEKYYLIWGSSHQKFKDLLWFCLNTPKGKLATPVSLDQSSFDFNVEVKNATRFYLDLEKKHMVSNDDK